jgi:hypothetical protein
MVSPISPIKIIKRDMNDVDIYYDYNPTSLMKSSEELAQYLDMTLLR